MPSQVEYSEIVRKIKISDSYISKQQPFSNYRKVGTHAQEYPRWHATRAAAKVSLYEPQNLQEVALLGGIRTRKEKEPQWGSASARLSYY